MKCIWLPSTAHDMLPPVKAGAFYIALPTKNTAKPNSGLRVVQEEADETRRILRTSIAAALGRGQRAQAVQRCARSDRARRSPRLRPYVGGRAPLPGGVFTLLRAGSLSWRRLAAHQEYPPWPRYLPVLAELQSSGARCRASCDARSGLGRPPRLGHRGIRIADRDAWLRRAAGAEDRDVARGRRADRQHDDHAALSGL